MVNGERKQRKNMKEKIILIIICLSALPSLISCGKNSDSEPKTEEPKKLTLVRVKTVEATSFTESFKVLGVIKPFATAKVSSEEGGLITSIPKDKGSYVSKGEVIVRIKKDVESATYNAALAQLELAKMNFQKQEQLYNDNATTEVQYLTAKWQLIAAEKGLDVLKARLRTAAVRSPISGVIDEKYMNRGEMSSPGMPILNIVDVLRVKVSAGVPETYISQIKTGQSVRVTSDVLPGVEFDGKINYVAPSLSNLSRTFEIEIVINNKDRVLKPEMNANVEISKTEKTDAVVIPQEIIIDYGDEQYVFTAEGDGEINARKRVIKIGGRNGNMVMVESGLNVGDKLITDGYQSLVDGMKVEIVE
jgi:RND family efflux transporter MFP subunit